ncbi:hypothetical protein WMC53_17075 (plasmid) [Halorubrum ezzemoulense]
MADDAGELFQTLVLSLQFFFVLFLLSNVGGDATGGVYGAIVKQWDNPGEKVLTTVVGLNDLFDLDLFSRLIHSLVVLLKFLSHFRRV